MSNIQLIIEERAANIGNFMVGRLLPFREKRMVGPFIFIDHMGRAAMSANHNLDVPPHPHIGLSTLTYLFEGNIMHRDSMGNEMEITPGEVNWMTAGKGVVHSERTPDNLRGFDKVLHGLQIWVALPKEMEEMDPDFIHIDKEDLPNWEEDGVSYKLISGEINGVKSPVPVYSRMFLLEIKSSKPTKLSIGKWLFGESALYILDGYITSEGIDYDSGQVLVSKESGLCDFEIGENSTIYVFGGEKFPEERYIHWNFVSSSKQLIEEAKNRWINQQFEKVPGETEFVPLPGY
jgi:redox-sensitive bicupin YhaK (pirin superfamily)